MSLIYKEEIVIKLIGLVILPFWCGYIIDLKFNYLFEILLAFQLNFSNLLDLNLFLIYRKLVYF